VLGIDETIERRRGKKIAAAGIYRDPVRSSHSHFVKVRGLRWICLMLLAPIPWAGRVWALPFFTVLAPSERAAQRQSRRFKPLTAWARQMIRQVHRWQPDRQLVVVGDRTYAALELLDAVRSVATVVTRIQLDARLFSPAPPRLPQQNGRPRLVGERLPNLTLQVQDLRAQWASLVISRWYGEADRPVEVLSQTAVWYSTGFPLVPIRWVLTRDPWGSFPTQALLCTDLAAEPPGTFWRRLSAARNRTPQSPDSRAPSAARPRKRGMSDGLREQSGTPAADSSGHSEEGVDSIVALIAVDV
jgi:hypothetical protein